MKHVLLQVYASLWPVEQRVYDTVLLAGEGVVGQEEPWLFLEGGLLRISWEGMYFPLDEVLAALRDLFAENSAGLQGKLDCLDLEAWTLTRYVFTGQEGGPASVTASTRSLNQVLEYSGH